MKPPLGFISSNATGSEGGADFGFWPKDEFCSIWTFAYDPHLPGVREALEMEEHMKVLERAKGVTYSILLRQRISELSEERAFEILRKVIGFEEIQKGQVSCPACGAQLMSRPNRSIKSDGVVESTQVCKRCKFVVKKEFRLSG